MKRIRMENFRCFENQEVEFRNRVNVLIGDNASGKTALLNACKYVLSSFFSGFSDDNTRWISPANHDFRTVINIEGVELPEKPIKIDFSLFDRFDWPYQNYNSIYPGEVFMLEKKSRKNSRALVSGIKELKNFTSYIYQNLYDEKQQRVYPLPLFSYFSTEDIHRKRSISAKKFLNYTQKPSFGYHECLEGNGMFNYWIKRLLSLQEGKKNTIEIEIVRKAVIDALGTNGCNFIEGISIRPIRKKVYFKLTDSREIEADLLSDGYKRLVYIVIDIAFRCALLNRELFGLESTADTRGTVLIDELDMHLHPALQATVIKGLTNAFPNIQFIVTTHAPMIMSSVENNKDNAIFKLKYSENEGHSITNEVAYGKDASYIIESIMEQKPRDLNVENDLEELFGLIDENDFNNAKRVLEKMKKQLGNDLPELYKAETMINILEEPLKDD